MAINRTLAGTTYQIPERFEKRWGAQLTAFLGAVGDILAGVVGGSGGVPVPIMSVASSTLLAGATLTPTKELHRVQGSPGAVTLSTTTAIAAGVDGQKLTLTGAHATNEVTITQQGIMAGINGDITLSLGRSINLVYNTTRSLWEERSRS